MEEKAKAYDRAIKRARKWHDDQHITIGLKGNLEDIFPELKESEDERIRKDILSFLRTGKPYSCPNSQRRNKWADWLEKQGEQNPFNYENATIVQKDFAPIEPKFKVGDKIVEKADECGCGTIIDIKDGKYIFNDGCFICIEEQGLWELVEQTSPDKVKPKFHEGEWVIDKQGVVHQIAKVIENVTNHTYGYDIVGGGYFNDNTEGVRLWTIQDAKDGNVLVDVYGNIGIYEKCYDFDWVSYCSLGHNGGFQHFKIEHENEKTYPATKEQREQLEKAMTDAGYRWNPDEKKIEKIEQKPAWSEEDDEMLDSIIEEVRYMGDFPDYPADEEDELYDECLAKVEWLESLKERVQTQNTLKPSDEQMTQLKRYCPDNRPLTSLYEQLKKLKA